MRFAKPIVALTCAGMMLVGAGGMTETSTAQDVALDFPKFVGIDFHPESLTKALSNPCASQRRPVVVVLTRYPNISKHVRGAIRRGQPRVMHIDRRHADQHRNASTGVLPTRYGYDRDEYPVAMSREGGRGADIRYVRSSENRSAGASMGSQLRPYCNGQAFRLKVR